MDEEMNETPLRVGIVGAGQRGAGVYAEALARRPSMARIVAVADPDEDRRERLAARHEVPPEGRFDGWEALLSAPRPPELLVVATPDTLHVAPAQAALARGIHLLLEKPIAPTLSEVLALEDAAAKSSGTVTVAHVLRHAAFFATLRELLRAGRIGDLVGVDHVENVGHWHFAHSYVRGNWRRQDESSPMILAKACHDLDLLRWLVDEPCEEVHSLGALHHFRPGNAPEGATDRCLGGCAVERRCPYSAIRIYLERFGGDAGWPNDVVAPGGGPGALLDALREGPYGRCVYHGDNDQPDHQVVSLRFAGGVTATLTVTAFSEENTRTIHLMGTHGEIRGHMAQGTLRLHDFAAGREEVVHVGSSLGHAAADDTLVFDLLTRLRRGDGAGRTALSASIDSHVMAFAAEASRHSGRPVRPDALRPRVS